MKIVEFGALIDVPWKNGGGITRNIAKGLRDGVSTWTISRAEVSKDGPFSDFSGMVRVLTVVSGGAMKLDSPTTTLEATLWEPVQFDGGLKVHARLQGGPLTDLNVMFDPAYCACDVVTLQGPLDQNFECLNPGVAVFHALAGTPSVNGARLQTGDTACLEQSDTAIVLVEGDALLEIRLTYLDHSDAITLCIWDWQADPP